MSAGAPERRVLDEAGGLRAMTGVMAVMLFLTVLVAALGLATARAAGGLDRRLAGRVTVQLVDGAPATREAHAAGLTQALARLPAVGAARVVPRAELAALLRPYVGDDAQDGELPVPAMVDVDLRDAGDAAVTAVTAAARRVDRGARVDRHARWMAPVGAFMRSLTWLAAGLVALMAAAAIAVAVLAARAGIETHRATIEVMHMLGSTDRQVARLFQRRVALDAAVGGGAGAAAGLLVAGLIGAQMAGLGSELIGAATLDMRDWLVLASLPVAFVVLATAAARSAVLAALRRTL